MTNQELKESTQAGLEMLVRWSKLIATLPMERWKETMGRAEVAEAIQDLLRGITNQRQIEIIQSILDAAIGLKKAVEISEAIIQEETQCQTQKE